MTKRELIDTGSDKRYVRRDDRGRFLESDDVGRSLSQDVRKPAKKTVSAGQGDRGDQKRTVGRSAATGRVVLMPVPKGSTVSVREARSAAREVIGSSKKK